MKDILTAKSKLQQIFLSYYFFSGAYFNKKMQNECKYRNYFFFCWFASPFGVIIIVQLIILNYNARVEMPF